MAMRAASAADHARLCTVAIVHDGRFLGSGFFVASQLVVTCAHVVWRRPDTVTVMWGGRELPARVLVRDPASHGSGDFYEHPDLAFLGVDDVVDNPSVVLAEPTAQAEAPVLAETGTVLETALTEMAELTRFGFRRGDRFEVFGYDARTPETGVVRDTSVLDIVGPAGRYVRASGTVVAGLSGAPVIRRESGHVHGVVKARDPQHPSSSFIITATDLHARLRRHRAALRGHTPAPPPLFRPEPGGRLHAMLMAQRELAERLPYRVVEGPVPLSAVYVEQRAEHWLRAERETATPLLRRPAAPEILTPLAMLARHRNALVIGGPGTGKSTLVQHLIAESARWWLSPEPARPGEQPPFGPALAVRVAATALTPDRPWFELIADAVNAGLRGYQPLRLPAEMFAEAPAPGAEWMILVDGLDEIFDGARRTQLIELLAHRVAEYSAQARYLITTRWLVEPELVRLRGSLTGTDRTGRLGEYLLRPFDRPAVETFAAKWFRLRPGAGSDRVAAGFLRSIDASGLGTLVRIPLLTTIAAAVYEQRPGAPLPVDRTGLYERFVAYLLTGRPAQHDVRAGLRAQLGPHGRGAEEFADFLHDGQRTCLRFIADRRLRSDDRPLPELAVAWVHDRGRRLPAGVTTRHLRDLLLSTGLVVARGYGLEFIHQSFAEFLAAEHAAEHFAPEEWLERLPGDGPDSVALFTLALWIRAGNDPSLVIDKLLAPGPDHQYPGLRHAAAILEDGAASQAPGEAGARFLRAVEQAVRRIRHPDERATAPLNHALHALLQRSSGSGPVVRIAEDRRIAPLVRMEAARVLVIHGSADDQRTGIATLARSGYQAPLGDEHRLWALRILAEVGGASERAHAVAHLAQCVETARRRALRLRAIILLMELYELPAAASALVRRAADRSRPVAEREDALSMCELLASLDDLAASDWRPARGHAGDLRFRSLVWSRSVPGPLSGRIAGTDFVDAVWQPFVSRLGHAVDWLTGLDPACADAVAASALRDRSIGWLQRVSMRKPLRDWEMAESARGPARVLLGDRRQHPMRRVLPLWLFRGPSDEAGRDALRRILLDPAAEPALRRETASLLLLRAAGGEDTRLTSELVSDRSAPFGLRLVAATLLADTDLGVEPMRRLSADPALPHRHRALATGMVCYLRLRSAARALTVNAARGRS